MKFALPVLTALLLLLKADQNPSVRVICYHTFRDAKNTYNFSVQELREQIEFLKSSGFTFVSAQDLSAGRVKGDRNILITIDDGNVSVYRAYKDVFKPHGIRPLLAIYPNVIGKKSYALSWEQLAELIRDGCDVAAHGYYHSILSEKNYEKDRKAFSREIVLSKKVLEEKLGRRVDFFVYPFGAYSDAAQNLVKETGYKLAFTIKPGAAAVPLNGNQLTVPRYMLTQETVKWQMHKISGALPGIKQGPAVKTRQSLVAKAGKDNGKEKQIAETVRKEKTQHSVKETAAVGARPHILKKGKEPGVDQKSGKERKKHHRRPEDKEVAQVQEKAEGSGKRVPVRDQKEAADLFHPAISPVEPAGGDVIFEDAYAPVVTPVKSELEITPAEPGSRGTGNPERMKLRKEFFSLTQNSCQTYAVIMDQMKGKILGLKRAVERIVAR